MSRKCNKCKHKKCKCSLSSSSSSSSDCNTCPREEKKHRRRARCSRDNQQKPVRVIAASLESTTDQVLLSQGIFASTVVNLGAEVEYRPRDTGLCDQRRVAISASPVFASSVPSGNIPIEFGVGVFYDTGSADFYVIRDCKPDMRIVSSTTPTTFLFDQEAELQKNRVIIIFVKYASGSIPSSGATVLYTPPVGTDTNVNVAVFNDNKVDK